MINHDTLTCTFVLYECVKHDAVKGDSFSTIFISDILYALILTKD